jgi:hypothetical protein
MNCQKTKTSAAKQRTQTSNRLASSLHLIPVQKDTSAEPLCLTDLARYHKVERSGLSTGFTVCSPQRKMTFL